MLPCNNYIFVFKVTRPCFDPFSFSSSVWLKGKKSVIITNINSTATPGTIKPSKHAAGYRDMLL